MKSFVSFGGLFILLLVVKPHGTAAATITLINHTNTWRYRKGMGSGPQANWKTVSEVGLDASWLSGSGGFGFADNTAETAECRTILTDMHNSYNTVAMRRTFQVTSNIDSNFHLVLTMDWDDGFIAWLDGVYVADELSPGAPAEPAFDDRATGLHESSRGTGSPQPPKGFDLGAIGSRLPIGTHVLSIIGLNEQPGSSDFIQIADLTALPPPTNGISGLIAEDTTWRAADSPIIVAGDITVNYGATLTIEPGVRVLFQSGLLLTVNGRLLAEGDPTNRIVFSRMGNSGSWGGIVIHGLAESRIRHAHIEFNGASAIDVIGGTAWLDHLTFGTHNFTYVNLSGASFIVSDCEFPSGATKFEFIHSRDIRADGHGIIRRNFFGQPVGYADVIDHSGGKRPAPILHIINNVFSGATDDGVDIDGTDAWLEGNIFQHVHRRGDTPDSSAAVSGGERNGLTSEITVIGNIFYDCDNAATAKQGNFYTFINNTIVHTTNAGGIDLDSGVFNVRDTTPSPTTFARGFYVEGNIIVDASQLVRNYTNPSQTTVTFNNNIVPTAWTGPGTNNTVTNPLLRHIPALSETVFTNWSGAQIYREWFSLQTNSPAIATGLNGRDKGAVIPLGASISGEPPSSTSQTNATLIVGVNRTGFGIPTSGWPNGSGYVAYKWRLDGGAWSAERSINTAISLSGLAAGPHYVEVVGKRDSGLYQDDPLFGADVTVTRSRTWIIDGLRITSANHAVTQFVLQFTAQSGQTYTVQYRDAFDAAHPWLRLTNIGPLSASGLATATDSGVSGSATRFYRLVTPAVP
jgi:hypothetical protein